MNRRLAAPRLADTIAAELEQRILEGSWNAGDRLPAERELSAQLGVSRASLREAIQKLVARGLLSTRQGGGTFVTDRLEAGFLDPWEELLQKHASVREDLLEFRELLEAKAAACAADHALALGLNTYAGQVTNEPVAEFLKVGALDPMEALRSA